MRTTQFRSLSDAELLNVADVELLAEPIGTHKQQDLIIELAKRLAVARGLAPNIGDPR